MSQTPRAAVEATMTEPRLPGGAGERFAGYGVMGLTFSSGYCLALRCWPATTIGPAYSAVFVRSPEGGWVIQTDAPPERSCPRYLSSAAAEIPPPRPIRVSWTGPDSVRIAVEGALEWRVRFDDTAATRTMSACASALPERAWASAAVLGAMGAVAGPFLGVGRVRLRGRTPNGQWFRVAPKQVWAVLDSSARWRGRDLGAPAPLLEQTHLADFWLPQRGIGYIGTAVFERFDPDRHDSPGAAVAR